MNLRSNVKETKTKELTENGTYQNSHETKFKVCEACLDTTDAIFSRKRVLMGGGSFSE